MFSVIFFVVDCKQLAAVIRCGSFAQKWHLLIFVDSIISCTYIKAFLNGLEAFIYIVFGLRLYLADYYRTTQQPLSSLDAFPRLKFRYGKLI